MKRFTKPELDRFNDRFQNVLENGDCVGIFEQYLRKTRINLLKVFQLWRMAHEAKADGGGVTETMADLMEEISGFNVETEDLEDVINICCDLLERKAKSDFMRHLQRHHH